MNQETIICQLKNSLNEDRYIHTIGVAKTASELAKIHGENSEKAYLAGLLHDCAKCFSREELLKKIEKYNIHLDEVSQKSPQLWHSYVGAYEARYVYGVEDKNILNAIYYHTIGRENMSELEKIIYLADAIEPMRSFAGVDLLRTLACISLDKAVVEYTGMSIEFILGKGALVHPNAYAIYGRQK